jgi:hypothetical protein
VVSISQEGMQLLQGESVRLVRVLPVAPVDHMVIARAVDASLGRIAVEGALLDRRLGIAGQNPDVVDRHLVD